MVVLAFVLCDLLICCLGFCLCVFSLPFLVWPDRTSMSKLVAKVFGSAAEEPKSPKVEPAASGKPKASAF